MRFVSDIRSIHLELTNRCQARCPMCPRTGENGSVNPAVHITEIDLASFARWFDAALISKLDNVFLCGNFGDPIFARDCLKILSYLRASAPYSSLSVHTNGSARTHAWWRALATTGVRVIFGIDGLRDTHSLYRIGTDWDKVIGNAVAFIDAGGWAEWHMLVFRHNEHQVKQCRKLSGEMGFAAFKTKDTNRFSEGNFAVRSTSGEAMYFLEPSLASRKLRRWTAHEYLAKKQVVSCKAISSKQIYISASGHVMPCCWIEFEYIKHPNDPRIRYVDSSGKLPSLHELSLQQIVEGDYFQSIEDSWTSNSLGQCAKHCGTEKLPIR